MRDAPHQWSEAWTPPAQSPSRRRCERQSMRMKAAIHPRISITPPMNGAVIGQRTVWSLPCVSVLPPGHHFAATSNSSRIEVLSSDSVSSPSDVASTRPSESMNTVVGMPRSS